MKDIFQKVANDLSLYINGENTRKPLYVLTPAELERFAERVVESQLQSLRAEVEGCFDMAFAEGLSEALAETADERLKDLVERRLMYALYAVQRSTTETPEGSDDNKSS